MQDKVEVNMPKISIIIPCFNVEKYLSRCLDSIINQTFKDLEIICIDDASSDNTVKILEEYAKKDNRIKVILQSHAGQSVARNKGLKIISGQYVSFIDSDDWVDIEYYEHLISIAEQHDADIVVSGMKIVDNENISNMPIKNFMTDNFAQKIKELQNGAVWGKLFRTVLFKGIKFPDGRYYEDNIVLLETMFYAKIVISTNRVSYYYFMNQSGTCRTTKMVSKKNEDRLYSARSMMSFAKEHGLGQNMAIKDFILRTVICDFISKSSPYYHETKQILGKFYVYSIKMKKLLNKIIKLFYKKNN